MYNYGDGVGTSTGRQYQGYPYVNPMFIDAPSIDEATAAKYNHLPRRPASDKKDAPVVYIDIPSGSGAQSTVSQPNTATPQSEAASPKLDPDDSPVVYIDLPTSSGSDVAERRVDDNDSPFVEGTIFYDPFKDRRINSDSDGASASSSTRPSPPTTLNLGPPSRVQSPLPPHLSKEASIYRPIRSPEDMYPTESRDFPEPPPAYSEHPSIQGSTVSLQSPEPVTDSTAALAPDPPRTQVYTTESQGLKTLFCMFCGQRTHTLTIKETGFMTHFMAIAFLLVGLFPVTILIYCTDYCKYNNYYCKHCNAKIAYDIPFLCQELAYVTN